MYMYTCIWDVWVARTCVWGDISHGHTSDIRRPLQSVERVRLHLLAYNIQPLPDPNP